MRNLLAIFLAFGVAAAGAAQRQSLPRKHVIPLTKTLTAVGNLEPTNILQVAVVLPVRNQAALDKLMGELHDPASTNYRHWLKTGEFAERFGPTASDYQAVCYWASSNRLVVAVKHEGRSSVTLRGYSPDVEKAFGVKLGKYQHPSQHRHFYAPDREPTLDLKVPVAGVVGLSDYATTTNSLAIGEYTTEPTSGSGPGGSYMGYDFRHAYLPGLANNVLTGTGQTIGILSFTAFHPTDITAYQTATGLPALTYTTTNINGGPGTGYNPEAILDIDMAWAMAPGAAIRIYQSSLTAAATTGWLDVMTKMANENRCKTMTCSYIILNVVDNANSYDQNCYYIAIQMAAQGQSFFTSSGDGNAYTTANATAETFPALLTNITVVGGTRLTTAAGAAWTSEAVWNTGPYGSGGGVGHGIYNIPDYQTNISMTANLGSSVSRNYPDVAMVAQGIYCVTNGVATTNAMGTSASTPLWAGLCALINQTAIAAGKPTVGWLNPSIYNLGRSSIYTNCFHDITSGNNFWSQSPTKFPAVTNFDLATGWGTPNGTNLINALFTGGPTIVNLVFTNGLFQRAY